MYPSNATVKTLQDENAIAGSGMMTTVNVALVRQQKPALMQNHHQLQSTLIASKIPAVKSTSLSNADVRRSVDTSRSRSHRSILGEIAPNRTATAVLHSPNITGSKHSTSDDHAAGAASRQKRLRSNESVRPACQQPPATIASHLLRSRQTATNSRLKQGQASTASSTVAANGALRASAARGTATSRLRPRPSNPAPARHAPAQRQQSVAVTNVSVYAVPLSQNGPASANLSLSSMSTSSTHSKVVNCSAVPASISRPLSTEQSISLVRSKRYSHVSAKVDTGLSVNKNHQRAAVSSTHHNQSSSASPQDASLGVKDSLTSQINPVETGVQHACHELTTHLHIVQDESVTSVQSVRTHTEMEIDFENSHAAQNSAQIKAIADTTVQHMSWSDEHDKDPQMVSEYAEEIFIFLLEAEAKTLPPQDYMQIQREIDWSMRGILVNWLVEVHHRLRLLPETLFLTVNLMDRFLSSKAVSANKLQLVGVTSLLVACKVEEISVPSVQVMVYMADNGYDADEILKAERYLLGMLKFNLGYTSPLSFLRRISRVDGFDPNPRTLCKYLLEATLADESMIGVPPSLLAAGAMYLARKILTNSDWTGAHAAVSSYTEDQVFPCAKAIFDCVSRPERHQSIYLKYAEQRFMGASKFIEEYIKRT